MKNRIHRTRRVAINNLTAAATVAYVIAGSIAGTLAMGGLSSRVDRRLRSRITDVRDRGALSLEQAIVTAVLSAAAIALGVVIVNAVVSQAQTLVIPDEAGSPYARRYHTALQEHPDAVIAHRGVTTVLKRTPVKETLH